MRTGLVRQRCAKCTYRREVVAATGPERRALSGSAPPASSLNSGNLDIPGVAGRLRWLVRRGLDRFPVCGVAGGWFARRPGGGRHAEMDGPAALSGDLVHLRKFLLCPGEADVQSFCFAEPVVGLGLGDAGQQAGADADGESCPAAVNAHTASPGTNSSGCQRPPAGASGPAASADQEPGPASRAGTGTVPVSGPDSRQFLTGNVDQGKIAARARYFPGNRVGWHVRSWETVPACQTGHPAPETTARHSSTVKASRWHECQPCRGRGRDGLRSASSAALSDTISAWSRT